MFEMLRARLMLFLSIANTRRMGRIGLHWPCLVVLVGLVIQLAMGMILNLYVPLPAADARMSYLREIETAPGMLTAHALIALVLLATAGLLLLRAIALRDVTAITLIATGLAALVGAFAAGEVFVRDGASGWSLSMAILTGVALLSYICLQAIIVRQRPVQRREPGNMAPAPAVPAQRMGEQTDRAPGWPKLAETDKRD